MTYISPSLKEKRQASGSGADAAAAVRHPAVVLNKLQAPILALDHIVAAFQTSQHITAGSTACVSDASLNYLYSALPAGKCNGLAVKGTDVADAILLTLHSRTAFVQMPGDCRVRGSRLT